METEKIFTSMTVDEMKSALVDREMELLDFGSTYSILMQMLKGSTIIVGTIKLTSIL